MNEFEALIKKVSELCEKFDLIAGLQSETAQRRAESEYTLHAWLDEWYTVYKAPYLKPSSLTSLRCGIDKHIKPNIPDKPLDKLTAIEIQKCINSVQTSRVRKYTYDTLCAALKQAYKLDIIFEDITVKTNKVRHRRVVGKALTVEQQAAFEALLNDNRLRPLYRFYLLTGCRKAEALAVKWADVDFTGKRIYIGGTKTDNSKRYVPIFAELEPVLAALPRDGDYVFPYSDNLVKCHFRRLKTAHKLPFSIHSLRHTFATRCIERGIAMNTVQMWLGHAQASTTANFYLHVQTAFELEEIARFNEYKSKQKLT